MNLCTIVDGYDPVGNRLTRNLDGNPITWTYDDLYRLTGQQKAGQVCTYTLDGVGNLKTMWEGGNFPKTFTFNAADRLVTMVEGVSLTTYAWTGYGALESEITGNSTTGYAYNGQDQLAVVTAPTGDKTTYSFDGDGLRRSVATTNVSQDPPTLDVTTMVWDGSDYLLLNEPTQNRVVLTLDSEIVSCGSKDLLTDPLGSLVKEISAGASLGGLVQLTPYGTLLPTSGKVSIPFGYIAAYGYYTDSAERDYVRARELYKATGRWMQTDPLWPAERAFGYVGSTPISHIDPSGLKCQAPNPCSDLKGSQGACIALLCSFKTVDDMIKYLKKAINIDPKDFQGIEKLVRSLWGKKFSPEECCKKASGAPGFGSMEWLIKLLCTNSWLWGKDPAWSACAKKHRGGIGFGGDEEENAKCHACCFQQFPEDGPFDRLRGLCQKACDGVG